MVLRSTPHKTGRGEGGRLLGVTCTIATAAIDLASIIHVLRNVGMLPPPPPLMRLLFGPTQINYSVIRQYVTDGGCGEANKVKRITFV